MECLSTRVKLQTHASFIPGPSTFCYNVYSAPQAAEGPVKEHHICPCLPPHSFFRGTMGRWQMSGQSLECGHRGPTGFYAGMQKGRQAFLSPECVQTISNLVASLLNL